MRQLFQFHLLLTAFCFFIATMSPAASVQAQPEEDLATLRDWLSGSFSSAAQAKADTNFRDIRLEIAPIWPERTDGFWLYVEQASAERLERPYRQRVYQLTTLPDGRYSSAVYELPDPLRFAGAWKNTGMLAEITPDSLILREGCAVILKRSDAGTFAGSTDGKACHSNLYGASYATSEVTVTATTLKSWDRGWDVNDSQVWGSAHGAYIFIRQNQK